MGGAASHVLYFMCCDFPDFGHKAKYAPFGMLGKPKSAIIIKGAHYRLWVSLYLVGGSLTSWAGNPFEPQFSVFLAQQRLEAPELDKIVVEQTEKWSSRTCSLAPDKLSNAPIYDLCGQLNHSG